MIRAVRVGVGCLVTHFVASIRLSTLPPSRACALWSVTPPVVPSRRAKPGGWRGLRDEWSEESEP